MLRKMPARVPWDCGRDRLERLKSIKEKNNLFWTR